MKSLVLIMLVAGCSMSERDDYPVQPSAGPLPGSTGGGVAGRLCVVADPRDLTTCVPMAAGGLAVTLAGAATTTAADGSFTIPALPPNGAMVGVSGPGVVPTQMALSPAMTIPVLKADLFSQMMAANGIALESGSGSILGTVTRAGAPVTGATVSSTPAAAFGPLFDGTTPTAWRLDVTGARGVIWLPGVAAGPTQLTFRDLASSGATTVDGVQVVDGGITITDVVLP
jgi:hypothetical protein